MRPSDGDTIVVWFSCGTASAVAAYETLRLYGDRCNVRIVNNPIAEEDEDNRRFLLDVEKWLGQKIEICMHPDWPGHSCEDVWEKRKFMSGIAGAPCTMILKKEARYHFERQNEIHWHVLGFTSEEKKRYDLFVLTERENMLPILIDAGLTKEDCGRIVLSHGIALPRVYSEGYPNANCIGCVKATSATYWNLVRVTRPEVFARRAEQSRRIGAKLVRYKGRRMFLDELPPHAKGRPLSTMKIECGIFCEEPTSKHEKSTEFPFIINWVMAA